jgi:ligand-binding sensor domain-containing protein/signal transduction histidine kinase/DNA-binding response OmpR family regulator
MKISHIKYIIILVWVLFFLSGNVYSARSLRFSHLTNESGLPTNTVFSICQDYKGFYWLATKGGLCKYDGKNITPYELETATGARLSGLQVRHVFEDKQKRLWAIAHRAVNVYDRSKDKFVYVGTDNLTQFRRHVYQDQQDKIYFGGSNLIVFNETEKKLEIFDATFDDENSGVITSITSDKNNRLWIGHITNGLTTIDLENSKKSHYTSNAENQFSLISNKIMTLYTDHNGNVWVGTEDSGICYYDVTLKKFRRIKGFPKVCVRAFAEDAEGKIWIGSEDGLFIYNTETAKLSHYRQNYNDKNGLNDNAIYSIFRDRENNMLIGTYFGGINIFSNLYKQFGYYDFGYSDDFLSGKAVRQIVGNKDGNLWIATEDGGLNFYDSKKEKFLHFMPDASKNSLSYYNVHSLLLDSGENLWIGTYLGGLNKYNLKNHRFTHYTVKEFPNLNIDNAFSLLEDSSGEIWIATTRGISIYNPGTNKFRRFLPKTFGNKSIDCLLEDSDGNIWIATRTHGVYCYNKTLNNIQNYAHQPNSKGLPDNFINYIYEDSKKNIWIATHESGLCKLNKEDESITVFTTDNGLPSNTIFSIIESNAGDIWISTNNGLSCLESNHKTFTNYSVSEGLPNKQFNYNSVYKDKNGLLYFGTINGMIAFHPDNLQSTQNHAKVEISSFKIYGKIISPNDENSPLLCNVEEIEEIRLNNNQAKSFTFDFTVPSISHSNSVFYAIKLTSDKDWSYIGKQNHVTYANLPPGEYTLNIKAAFNNKWNEADPVKSIKIIIEPPIWKSTIAYIIYMLMVVLMVYLLYRFQQKRHLEKRLVLSERLEKEKLREINNLKLNFFTNISHEFRTPLSLIILPIQSLKSYKKLQPDVLSKLKIIANNAKRLNNLVEELMLFTKIETKQEKIKVEKGNLSEFTRTICEGFRILADDKGLQYEININNTASETWFAPEKVEKVIYNLLSNAFKYTTFGTITVKAFFSTENDGDFFNLIVSDTGMGISADQKEQIFENYYQINDFIHSKPSGFGIGLALVKEIVLLHKGTIEVKSEIDKGSDFIVKINVSGDAFENDEKSDCEVLFKSSNDYHFKSIGDEINDVQFVGAPTREINHKSHTILIVEDNIELLNFYVDFFKNVFSIITAFNGKEGLEKAKQEQPDLIVSDIMMPDMNGYEMSRKIKNRIETSHIPVILITAKTGEDARMEGFDSGADIYMEKPFNPTHLLKQITNLIATKENQRKLYQSNKIDLTDVNISERDLKLLNSIEKFIIDNLDDSEMSLKRILEEVGVGRTVLHVKLKSILGLSTTQFINNIRLKESINFLKVGNNISQTAYACGFSSPNYYTRCFHKFFGMSPNEYITKCVKEKDSKSTVS